MFILTGATRSSVLSYRAQGVQCIHIEYVREWNRSSGLELVFVDTETRDLCLAELDTGRVFLIDHEKIRGLKR